ncbi:VOC family protein [Dehalococcoidia bacterium]|nr:VOC family protein [Dehalococcoidia bacterium]
MFKRVDHVVIAVSDLAESMALYEEKFGLKAGDVVESPELGLRRVNMDVGNAYIELAQPTDETGPVGKFLENRGEGLYLLAVEVDDLIVTAQALRDKGARIIGDENSGGQVFVHPATTHGMLLQLIPAEQS